MERGATVFDRLKEHVYHKNRQLKLKYWDVMVQVVEQIVGGISRDRTRKSQQLFDYIRTKI